MKKLLLLLCVISVTALMTSCIDRRQQFIDDGFVYIAMSENNVRYGIFRSRLGYRIITNEDFRQGSTTFWGRPIPLNTGEFFRMFINWNEGDGFVALDQHRNAHEVTLHNVVAIPRASVSMIPPETNEVPEEAYTLIGMETPLFSVAPDRWSDHWVIEFYYIGGEEPPVLAFYKREPSGDDITIDIRVREITPVTQPIKRRHAVAVNMADIRSEFEQEDQERLVRVRFHFWSLSGTPGLPEDTRTDAFPWRLAAASSQE